MGRRKSRPNITHGDRKTDGFPLLAPRHTVQLKAKPRKARNALAGVPSNQRPPRSYLDDTHHAGRSDGTVRRWDREIAPSKSMPAIYHDLPEPEPREQEAMPFDQQLAARANMLKQAMGRGPKESR